MSFNSHTRLLRFPASFRRSIPATFSASYGPYLRPTSPTTIPWIRFVRPSSSNPTWPLPSDPRAAHPRSSPASPRFYPPGQRFPPAPLRLAAPLPAGDLRCRVSCYPCCWRTVGPLWGSVSGPLRLFAPILVGLSRSPIVARSVVLLVCLRP